MLGAILLELDRSREALEAFQRARILDPEEKSYEQFTLDARPASGARLSSQDLDRLTGM